MHGVFPEVKNFQTFRQEVEFIVEYLQQVEKQGGSLKDVCFVAYDQ